MNVITITDKKRKGIPDDLILDFEGLTFPYEDSSVVAIYLHNILQTLHPVGSILKECWRVLKIEGFLDIIVPDAPAKNAFENPKTCHYFTTVSLESIIDPSLWKTLNFDSTPEVEDKGDTIVFNKRREIHVKIQPIKKE